METFPKLSSTRLHLRQANNADIPTLVRYIDKSISDQIINFPHPYTEQDAIDRLAFIQNGFLNKQRYVFAICLQNNEKLIGEIGLHLNQENNTAETGYWIAQPYWGKGIASEALALAITFGFEQLDLDKISATHYLDNMPSGKVLINNGMVKTAILEDYYMVNNESKAVNQYQITREQYNSREN